MPVDFLTDEQRTRYGRFTGEPTPEELARYFHLDDIDREVVARHRGEHNQVGFAVQLCTVRFLGTFLEDRTSIPAGVLTGLARQLAIAQAACFTKYATGQTRWEHTTEIRQLYGYRDFSAGVPQFRLNRWLYALCWTGTDRPGRLFDRATAWLTPIKCCYPA
jgi:TnpA family transposase